MVWFNFMILTLLLIFLSFFHSFSMSIPCA